MSNPETTDDRQGTIVPKIKAGDAFLYYSRYGSENVSTPVVIGRVGRKWAYLEEQDGVFWGDAKVDIETMEVDGKGFGRNLYGKLYRTEGEWLAEQAAQQAESNARNAWKELHDWVSQWISCPAHLDAKTITDVLAVLRGERNG